MVFLQPHSSPAEGLAYRSSWYWWKKCLRALQPWSRGPWSGRAFAEWNCGAQASWPGSLLQTHAQWPLEEETFSPAQMPNGHSPYSQLSSPWRPLLVLGGPWAYVPPRPPTSVNQSSARDSRAVESGVCFWLWFSSVWLSSCGTRVALCGRRPFPVDSLGVGAALLCPHRWPREPECSQPQALSIDSLGHLGNRPGPSLNRLHRAGTGI